MAPGLDVTRDSDCCTHKFTRGHWVVCGEPHQFYTVETLVDIADINDQTVLAADLDRLVCEPT